MNRLSILTGDCREILPTLPAGSVQCCVTSPPYWGLRDYGTAEWEGGSIWCEHLEGDGYRQDGGRVQVDGFHGSSKTNLGEKSYRDVCPKCGARRIDSQLGLESSPEEYITNMVAVFRAVWRVLRDDGTLWVNMGDSYAGGAGGRGDKDREIPRCDGTFGKPSQKHNGERIRRDPGELKPKDLCMMPPRLALALQADGWYLRSEIVWHKPNPMPESVTDRPTKAHEMIYLLTKNGGKPLIWQARDTGEWSYNPDLSEVITPKGYSKIPSGWDTGPGSHTKLDGHYDLDQEDAIENETWKGSRFDKGKTADHQLNRSQSADSRAKEEPIPRWKGFDYFYDAEAIREIALRPEGAGNVQRQEIPGQRLGDNSNLINGLYKVGPRDFRNKRSVWTIVTQPYAEAHFATFPEEIPKLCILAGSKPGDTVLDPFAGSGTTGKVAFELGRKAILIELNPAYIKLAEERTFVTPGFF
jgi:site-specific DNA-methyltransferase (adenine-specific)